MSLGLITSDIHIHDKWFSTSERFFEFLKEVIDEYKPEHFFHLGDLFENKDHISNRCKRLVVDFLKFLADRKIHSSFLVGNHDCAGWENNEPITTTYFISGYDLATEIKQPILVTILDRNVLFLPYIGHYPSFDEIEKVLVTNKKENVDYVFVHGDVKGWAYPSGALAEDGWDYEEIKPRIKALFGHYHLPDIDKGIVGSPFMRDFRDALPYNRRIDFGVYLVEFSEVNRFSYEFIPFESEYYVKMSVKDKSQFRRKFAILEKNYKGKKVRLWVKQKSYFNVKEEIELFDREVELTDLLVTGDFEADEQEGEERRENLFFNQDLLKGIILEKIPKEFRGNHKFIEVGNSLLSEIGLSFNLDRL